MKNLLLYVNPNKKFDSESEKYAEIQIENSRKYGRKEDTILVTNFPYEHYGFKAREVPGDLFCKFDAKASKINVIVYLLEKKILKELTWFHDLEAFQISPIDLVLKKDLGLTNYGWKTQWNTGSFFFKPSALDILRLLQKEMYKLQANEEPTLYALTKENRNNILDRCERLNITYNVGKRKLEHNIKIAEKPIRVVHFHPYRENLLEKFEAIIPEELYKMIDEKSPYLSESKQKV